MTVRCTRNNRKWVFCKLALSAYLIAGLFALVGLRASVVNLEYELAELNRQKITLVRKSNQLGAQRASLYSARKIEHIATDKLGMQLPERADVFYVKRTAGAEAYRVSMDSGSGGSSRVWR